MKAKYLGPVVLAGLLLLVASPALSQELPEVNDKIVRGPDVPMGLAWMEKDPGFFTTPDLIPGPVDPTPGPIPVGDNQAAPTNPGASLGTLGGAIGGGGTQPPASEAELLASKVRAARVALDG